MSSEVVVSIVLAIFASSGFWAWLTSIYNNRSNKKTIERRALLGLLHEQVIERCDKYISQGWISIQDYEDLTNYIYKPYRDLGGNGTGEALYNRVSSLKNAPPDGKE